MKDRINTYFAVLLITITGAGATMLIVHFAFSDTLAITLSSGATLYSSSF